MKAIYNRIILTTVVLLSPSSYPNGSSTNKCNQVAAEPIILEPELLRSKSSSTNTTTPAAKISYEPWTYNVFADWHGAETFVRKPATVSALSGEPASSSMAWNGALKVLQHIKDTYGGELTLLVGDTNTGKWTNVEFQLQFRTYLKEEWNEVDYENYTKEEWNTFVDSLSNNEVVNIAGYNCYSTIKKAFKQVGFDNLLVCVGDHEIGGNPWRLKDKENTLAALPAFREALSLELSKSANSIVPADFIASNIGSATSRPIGTPFEQTSFAYIHKNALFITVDVFETKDRNYFLRSRNAGGEGAVSCTVSGDHLTWFESVLIAANTELSSTIDHIFVQGHVPILQPVRKMNCSGQYLDRGTANKFWKLMRKNNVDVYFAGEVHANTASKDPASKLIQIASRGNRFNNFLRVNVEEDGYSITSYNEIGTEWRWNANYTPHGLLTVDKSVSTSEPIIESSGTLEFINRKLPLIWLKFDKKDLSSLESRIILGMKYKEYKQTLGGVSKDIRGETSFSGLINYGNFGQQYDAQVANVNFAKGIVGPSAVVFKNERSRIAIDSMGPLGQGEPISLSFFFKTTNTGEMIMVAYAGQHKPFVPLRKDIVLLTIKDGVPIFYADNTRYVIPEGVQGLNDGVWHHIAISMRKKSCLLSEVVMYVDGLKTSTSIHGKDKHMFFYTSGSLSFGGWGYSDMEFEKLFPDLTHYEGMMDDFHLWARKIKSYDLRLAMKKNFQQNIDVSCKDNERSSKVSIGRREAQQCHNQCRMKPSCWGYELEPHSNGEAPFCYLHNTRPTLGELSEGAQCNPTF